MPRRQRSRRDQLAPRPLLGRLPDRLLQLADASVDEIDRVQVGVERDLLGGVLEALLAEPLATHDRPGAGRQQASVAQTELREPLPVAHPIKTRVLAGAHQVAGCLHLRRGNVDRLEQPAREQPRQLARVPRIGLDPVARPLRHQPRRHHGAVDPALDQVPIQAEAGRARLIAAAHRRPAAQQPLDRLLVVGQRPLLEQLVGAHRRQPDRARVNVQPDRYRRRRVVHGRRPPYVALPGPPRQPTTDA